MACFGKFFFSVFFLWSRGIKLFCFVSVVQGFFYISEVGTRGLLNLGKKHLDQQSWENLRQSKRTGLPF